MLEVGKFKVFNVYLRNLLEKKKAYIYKLYINRVALRYSVK